ncbi:hypothetical protein [Halomarina litorea]|uniref:hypothetical protein n=1 Tax=Halomarina litorea TaxID=2961595 RepID=UPI0020C4F657|nr:hypothetical protein [Halomarina sp. BCD28]
MADRGRQSAVEESYQLGSASVDLLRRSAALSLRGMDPFVNADLPAVPPVRIPLAPAGVAGPTTAPPVGDAFDAFLAAFEVELSTHPAAME